MNTIARLYYKQDNGDKTWHADSVILKEGFGIEGDMLAGKPGRHVSIMGELTRDKINELSDKGLCMKRFKENITISGELKLKPGSEIRIGSSVIRITKIGKKCFNNCDLYGLNSPCPMFEVMFGEVVSSGIIRIGDDVNIIA